MILTLQKDSNAKVLTLILGLIVITIVLRTTLLFRFCVIVEFIACLYMGSKETKFINPYYIFSITPLSLAIYANIGGFYLLKLTPSTWILAIINIFVFIATVNFSPNFKATRNCIGVASSSGLMAGAIIMFLLFMLSKIVPILHAILWFSSIASMVFALKTKKAIGYVLCICLFLTSLLSGTTSKLSVLTYLFTFLICYDKFYCHSRKQKKIMVGFILASIFFMVYAFSFANKDRGIYEADKSINQYEKYGKFKWDYDASFFLPYMYLTTPWTNLQFVTETQDVRTHGLWIAKPLLGYIKVDENMRDVYTLVPYSSFNTFTFISCQFKDFGYWLSIIPTILLAFFVKLLYSRYVISRSPFDITSYTLTAIATAMMFFNNHFFMLSYPFTGFIIMELYKYVSAVLQGKRYIDIEPS